MIAICKNCKYYEKITSFGGFQIHQCLHSLLRKTDIVTGKKVPSGSTYCYDVRADKNKCGLTGKWYKARITNE